MIEEIAGEYAIPAAACLATGGAAVAAYAIGSKRARDALDDGKDGKAACRIKDGALDVSKQGLEEINEDVLSLDAAEKKLMKSLNAAGNAIKIFPSPQRFQCLKTITSLNLSGNELAELPAEVALLKALKDLDLGRNRLVRLPSEIGSLKSLETLNLMCNLLTELPPEIGQLKSLYRLGLKGNKLESLPREIGGLKSLREAFLSDNLLTSLPAEMGQLKSLVKLQLSWNRLETLPEEMALLPNLELMRVAVNRIKKFPLLFVATPKLAWFSLAGNPASIRPLKTKALASIEQVDFSKLQAGETIGEGASGDVFLSSFKDQTVAVKVFKTEASPDGQASDEIAVTECLDHPHLTKVVGETSSPRALLLRHEKGSSLAKKPNLQSLLACRWEEGQTFKKDWVLAVLTRVADALCYMHSKGVCHGDVYAHNVLTTEEGEAVLCDFGASFFYSGAPYGLWELMEVRAFGLLLKDMVSRVEPKEDRSSPVLGGLSLLVIKDLCLSNQPELRPSFRHVMRLLGGVAPLVSTVDTTST